MSTKIDETTVKLLTADDLKELASVADECCVSLLMPTHRSGPESQQGPIRLKNLLGQARKELKASDREDALLEQVALKVNDKIFWQHQGEGLAIFLTSDSCRMYRLNRPVEETVHFGESFLVQPLVSESTFGGQYFVLTLSWDEAKLFRAASESLSLIETRRLPAKFDELVLPRDPEESLQNTSHRAVGNTRGTSTGMFHGQGEGESKISADRDQYLSIVGDEVATAIYNTGMPLVVVATSEVTGHFESTTKVAIDAKVKGSPSEWTADKIREHAHDAMAARAQSDRPHFEERFGAAMAHSKAAHDLDEVLQAAKAGRVDALMVCRADEHREKTNQIVVETLRNGGDVQQCTPESMPTPATAVAAILRY